MFQTSSDLNNSTNFFIFVVTFAPMEGRKEGRKRVG
jgi:hypothetical protein